MASGFQLKSAKNEKYNIYQSCSTKEIQSTYDIIPKSQVDDKNQSCLIAIKANCVPCEQQKRRPASVSTQYSKYLCY